MNLGRAIVTNGDFTAYVCDSAATRPTSQVTLGRLVIIIIITIVIIINMRASEEAKAKQNIVFGPVRLCVSICAFAQ